MQENKVEKPNYHVIFHIDMNCFFASCEIASRRELEDKPVIIAKNDVLRKSIILTANYVARKYGIYTTMLVRDAVKLCPNVIIIEPHIELYQEYSKKFFAYLYKITNKIEPMSIDEGFLDMTDLSIKYNVMDMAHKIQDDIYNLYHLPCSIGIAPNKFLAKMASDMKKPMGITILRKREINSLLWPLPIKDMYGVGKKTAPKLNAIGINTIGDLANYQNISLLIDTVGKAMASSLIEYSNGKDNSLVQYEGNDEVSSISRSITFDYDTNDIRTMKTTLKILMNDVINQMNEKNVCALNIGIQIKYGDFHQISRSKGLEKPTNDSFIIWSIVENLFDTYYIDGDNVRLLGVFAGRLSDNKQEIKQYTLFDDLSQMEKEYDVHKLLKEINCRYGENFIHIGYEKKNDKNKN